MMKIVVKIVIKKGFGIVFALGLLLVISGLLATWLSQEQNQLHQYKQSKRLMRFDNITYHSLEWFGFLLYLDAQKSNIDSLDELWTTTLKNERLSDLFKTYPEVIEQDPHLKELSLQGNVIDLNRTLNLHQVALLYLQYAQVKTKSTQVNELKETNKSNSTAQERTNEQIAQQIKQSFSEYHQELLTKAEIEILWNQAINNTEQNFPNWYDFLSNELKLSWTQKFQLLQQTTWINNQPLSLNINTASVKLLKFFMPDIADATWQNFISLRQKVACKDILECENRLQDSQKQAFRFELSAPWSFPQFSVNSSHFLLQGMISYPPLRVKSSHSKLSKNPQNQASWEQLNQELAQSEIHFPIIALYDRLLWERTPEKGMPLWYASGF